MVRLVCVCAFCPLEIFQANVKHFTGSSGAKQHQFGHCAAARALSRVGCGARCQVRHCSCMYMGISRVASPLVVGQQRAVESLVRKARGSGLPGETNQMVTTAGRTQSGWWLPSEPRTSVFVSHGVVFGLDGGLGAADGARAVTGEACGLNPCCVSLSIWRWTGLKNALRRVVRMVPAGLEK